jgi:uncharacterized PurR-regulated membrane protein YhhQ (DUF165 family)
MELGRDAVAFNYGPAAARAIIYFMMILAVSWTFYTALAIHESGNKCRKPFTDTNG